MVTATRYIITTRTEDGTLYFDGLGAWCDASSGAYLYGDRENAENDVAEGFARLDAEHGPIRVKEVKVTWVVA